MAIQEIDLGTIAQDGADGDLAREAFTKVNTNFEDLEDRKVDKVAGKQLSTEDYTTPEKSKLAGIQSGATANQTDAYLLNRANHTGTQAISTVTDLATTLSTIETNLVGKQNTLFAGANITIDNTDPLTPVISASGGGGGGLTLFSESRVVRATSRTCRTTWRTAVMPSSAAPWARETWEATSVLRSAVDWAPAATSCTEALICSVPAARLSKRTLPSWLWPAR